MTCKALFHLRLGGVKRIRVVGGVGQSGRSRVVRGSAREPVGHMGKTTFSSFRIKGTVRRRCIHIGHIFEVRGHLGGDPYRARSCVSTNMRRVSKSSSNGNWSKIPNMGRLAQTFGKILPWKKDRVNRGWTLRGRFKRGMIPGGGVSALSLYTSKGIVLFQDRSGTDRRSVDTSDVGQIEEQKRVRPIKYKGKQLGGNVGRPGPLGGSTRVGILQGENCMATAAQGGGTETKRMCGHGSLALGLGVGQICFDKPCIGDPRATRPRRYVKKNDRAYTRTRLIKRQHSMYLNLFSLSFYTVKGTALFQERSGTDRRIGETRGTGRLKEHKRVRFIALIGNKFGANAGGPGLLGRWPCVSMLPRKNHMATPTQGGGNEIKGIYGQGSLTFGLEDGSNYLGKPRSGNFRVIRLHRFGGKEDRCYIRTFYVNIQHLIYSNLYSSGCRAGEEAVSERKPRYKVSIVRFGSGFSDKYSGKPGLVQPRGKLGLFLMIKRGWWRMAYKSGATEVAVNRVRRIR